MISFVLRVPISDMLSTFVAQAALAERYNAAESGSKGEISATLTQSKAEGV